MWFIENAAYFPKNSVCERQSKRERLENKRSQDGWRQREERKDGVKVKKGGKGEPNEGQTVKTKGSVN